MQKRLIAAPSTTRLHHQIPSQRTTPPTLELIERHHRRQHPVHRPRRPLRRQLADHHHVLRRPPRPRSELAQLRHRHPIPRHATPSQKRPERSQVPRIRLDRVRRTLDPRQPTKELINQRHRSSIRPDHRPRLNPARRHPHPASHKPPPHPIDISVIHDTTQHKTPRGRTRPAQPSLTSLTSPTASDTASTEAPQRPLVTSFTPSDRPHIIANSRASASRQARTCSVSLGL